MQVLFLQPKADLLKNQLEEITNVITSKFPSATVFGCSNLNELEPISYTVLIAPTHPMVSDVLKRSDTIEWVHFLSAGVELIWDWEVNWKQYIVTKSNGVHANAISEYIIGSILHVKKKFNVFELNKASHKWERYWLESLENKRITFFGYGEIAKKCATICKAFGMDVVAVNTSGVLGSDQKEVVDKCVKLDSVLNIIGESDFNIGLLPLTKQTKGFFDKEFFKHCKKRSLFMNVGRGQVVNQAHLIQALKEGNIASAILDVFEEEPLPRASELWELNNVFLTPHVSGTLENYLPKALAIFCENYDLNLNSAPLKNAVKFDSKY